MFNFNQLVPIGKITKPHGIEGRLEIVYPDAVYADLLFEHIFVMHEGLPVPYMVKERTSKNHTADLLKLYEIESDFDALRLKDCEVFVEKSCLEAQSFQEGGFTLASLIGYTVYESKEGLIGHVLAIDTSSANTLLLLEHPDGFQFSVPFHDDLVQGIVPEVHEIILTLPEGLLEVLLDE